ncbi:restriction endonuclease subunit S [Tessaracoccus sp. MC1679]|nr:restriction endonuclease subunit S [Tessaracoccus sp. MC1679]MBB1514998.1 restriction endonuclease subunit S [Tessaracoccus sp. MC1679]
MNSNDLKLNRWGDVGDIDVGPAFHRRFRPGQVLYGSRRTYLRKVAVAEFDGVCANTTFVVEPTDLNALLPDFLPFIMSAEPFHAFAIAESKGSVNPYVNWSDIARYEFLLPALDEQKRIADLLWAAERHRASLRLSATRARLTIQHWLDDTICGLELARPLRAVVGSSAYGPRFSNSLYSDDGEFRLLRTTDMDGVGRIDYGTMPRARLDDSFRPHLLADGDFLISRSGSCGVPAVFDVSVGGDQVIPGAFLIRLRLTEEMDPHFLRAYFNSAPGRNLSQSLAQGGVQKNIRGSSLLAAHVPVPTRATQAEIMDTLGRLLVGAESINGELAALDAVRFSLIDDILGGA